MHLPSHHTHTEHTTPTHRTPHSNMPHPSRGGSAAALSTALLVLLALALPTSHAQLDGPSGFVGLIGAAAPNATTAAPVCQGKTPASLIIESVQLVPNGAGGVPSISLRNAGGQSANITGHRLAAGNSSGAVLTIGSTPRCRENGTLASGEGQVWTPKSDANPCGFEFALGPTGSITLSDASDKLVATASWSDEPPGSQVVRAADGSYVRRLGASGNVLDVLRAAGDYGTFLEALRVTGIDQALVAANDPAYAGVVLPDTTDLTTLQLPWWTTGLSPSPLPAPAPPPPPPPAGIPPAGPYTVLAPNDAAFDALLLNLGGSQNAVPRSTLWKLPVLKDIIAYHIVPGLYTSAYLRNNTPIYTAKGVEVVPIVDGCQTEGRLMLHDSCIDKPTPDEYDCLQQKAFAKCDTPLMTSALAAQWGGGFCQRTCQRCSCAPDSGVQCASVTETDLSASNGVVHGISRVLFPPPAFSKEQALNDARAYNASVAANQTAGLPITAPQLGAIAQPLLPGAGAQPTLDPAAAAPAAQPSAAAPAPPAAALAPEAAAPAPAPPAPDAAAPTPAPTARRLLS